jgi:hypothetical protein
MCYKPRVRVCVRVCVRVHARVCVRVCVHVRVTFAGAWACARFHYPADPEHLNLNLTRP